MIEATCAACGTVNRIAEAELPPGAKSVTCTNCKARVLIPAKPAMAIPTIPKSIPAIPKREPVADLPAPKASEPTKRAATGPLADLPAPKRASPLAGLDASKPAPKSALEVADLPAPKGKPMSPLDLDDVPPALGKGVEDLPAPKPIKPAAPVAGPVMPAKPPVADLPAPKRSTSDLLTPKATAPASTLPSDLLAPKAPANLPAPKPAPVANLPVPKAAATPPKAPARPAPPAPAPALELEPLEPEMPQFALADEPGVKIDLPAPKGFFDDLPQPAKLGGGAVDLPAPKGFFDDLPQPAKLGGGAVDLPAPKGFFDDLPQPAKPAAAEPPAPKGFFDDLPQAAKPATQVAPAAKSFFDDPSPPAKAAEPAKTTLDNAHAPAHGDLDLEPPSPLELELAPATVPPQPPSDFGDLDLSPPTEPPATKPGITIKTPAGTRPRAPAASALPTGSLSLDLESESEHAKPVAADVTAAANRTAAVEAASAAKTKKQRRSRVTLGVLLLVVAGGGGGYYYNLRRVAAKHRAEEIDEHLGTARRTIHQGTPDHWQRAASEAGAVLQLDAHNPEAIGLRAEALLAGAFDTGTNGTMRIAQGKKLLADALEANITDAQLDAGRALEMLAAHETDRAVQKLQAMVAHAPKNGFWELYLGWALAAKGDLAGAVKAFDAALAAEPAAKLPALYARGAAKLQLLDVEGAKADFAAVLDVQKDHIGAQVGLAAALPPAKTSERESDLLAILARKDIGAADPRAVVQAWTLAADIARNTGRLDVARDRYQKALALAKTDAAALVGAAATELADGKPDVAADFATKALAQAPDSAPAQLVAAEIDVKQGKLDDAIAIEQKLAARTPPLPPLQQASMQLLLGNALDARGSGDDALDAWVAGAKLAGDADLSPMMAAVQKLGALAKHADDIHDTAGAQAYRDRADQLLSSLADRAKEDASLSRTLGAAYLGAGDPAKAEMFLQRAVDLAGDDVDAHAALAQALERDGKTDDALAQLDAAQKLDPSRADIGLEKARILEDAKRVPEAEAAYLAMLAAKDITVQARVRAGRFLVKTADHVRDAVAQADPILAAEPDNPAGHFLRGVGFALDQKLDLARRELTLAVDADPDPQYLQYQGLVAEQSVAASGDPKYYDLAQRAYERATAAAPDLEAAQAGLGRIYMARKEWSKALLPLLAAAKLAPTDSDVLFDVGLTYKNLGQPKVAADWFRDQLKQKKTARTYWELGQIDEDTNRGSETIDAYREATRLGVDEEKAGAKLDWLTEAFYRLGEVEQLAHDDVAARAAFQHFVDRGPPPGVELTQAKSLLTGELRAP